MTMKVGNLRYLSLFVILLSFTLPTAAPGLVHAQGLDYCVVSYQYLNGDTQPDLAIIKCPFAGDENDTVYVYDRAGDMQATGDWRTSTDFKDDLWVFDAGGDGTANLIIDFHQDGTALQADLYDDQDGDGKVSYTVTDGYPAPTESSYWTVRCIAEDGWWTEEGKVNFNLDILVDGRVRGDPGPIEVGKGRIGGYLPENILEKIRSDGIVEYVTKIRDSDSDGHPDYDFRQSYLPIPDSWAVLRTSLMVNPFDDEAPPVEKSIFWPYLGNVVNIHQSYNQSPPPVQVDWEYSKITNIAEFVASRANDHNWFIYSLVRFGDNREYANNENPFAFYDLAADKDGIPELQVRVAYFEPNDPMISWRGIRVPFETIRYSWDQDNDQTWDYKVNLTGQHAQDTVVRFPEFSVHTIPYDELPYWVTQHTWDAVTFVAWESNKAWTSEGIYAGGGSWDEIMYVLGLTEAAPTEVTPPTGFREEVSIHFGMQPFLYFSPTDRKLHLLGAERGIWSIDSVHRMEYDDLNGDGFIDRWLYFANEDLKRLLVTTQEFLVYSDEHELILKQANVPPAPFQTLPPRDHQDWQRLGAQLESYQRDFAPDDFKAMVRQFSGPILRIEKANARDFRLTDEGFHFVLDLRPGFRIQSDLEIAGAADLRPGAYLFTCGSRLAIQELTPPSLNIEASDIRLDPTEPHELDTVHLFAAVRNDGLEDAHDVAVSLHAVSASGSYEVITTTLASIWGNDQEEFMVTWVPNQPGRWEIGVEIDASTINPSGEHAIATAAVEVEVQPAQLPSWWGLWTLWAGERFGVALSALFASIVVAAATLASLILRGTFCTEGQEVRKQ